MSKKQVNRFTTSLSLRGNLQNDLKHSCAETLEREQKKVQLLQVSNFFTLFHFVAFIAFHFLLLPGIYFLSLHTAEEKMEDSIQVP